MYIFQNLLRLGIIINNLKIVHGFLLVLSLNIKGFWCFHSQFCFWALHRLIQKSSGNQLTGLQTPPKYQGMLLWRFWTKFRKMKNHVFQQFFMIFQIFVWFGHLMPSQADPKITRESTCRSPNTPKMSGNVAMMFLNKI